MLVVTIWNSWCHPFTFCWPPATPSTSHESKRMMRRLAKDVRNEHRHALGAQGVIVQPIVQSKVLFKQGGGSHKWTGRLGIAGDGVQPNDRRSRCLAGSPQASSLLPPTTTNTSLETFFHSVSSLFSIWLPTLHSQRPEFHLSYQLESLPFS